MYEDFLRARKKLKRKCCYTRPRQRGSLWSLHKRMEKTLVILLSKATEHKHFCKANDFYKSISDAARRVSSVLRPKCPYLNGVSGSEKKLDKDEAISPDSRYEDPLDASTFLVLVRILFQKEVEKLPAFENDTFTEDIDTFNEDCAFGSKESNSFDMFEDTQHEKNSETNLSETERLGLQHSYEGERIITQKSELNLLHDGTKINYQENVIRKCPYLPSPTDTNDFPLQILSGDTPCYSSTLGYKDITSRLSRDSVAAHQEEDFTRPSAEDAAVYLGCWDHSAGPAREYPGFERLLLCEGDGTGKESLGLIDWNELCGDRSNVPEVEDDHCSEDGDALSGRITYNTKPTASPCHHTPAFVCSAATVNTEAFQFGEERMGIAVATNFNVNAINNKGPLWKDMKGGVTLEQPRHKEVKGGSAADDPCQAEVKESSITEDLKEADCNNYKPSTPESGEEHANSCATALKNVGKVLSKHFMPDSKWWRRFNPTATTPHHPGESDKTVTTGLCVLVAICVLLLTVTGNVFSLVGVVLDVIVHAALLSLVVIIAMTVFEANDETQNPFLQGCNTFLELIGCVEPTPDKERPPTAEIAHPIKDADGSDGGGDSGYPGNGDDDGGGGGDRARCRKKAEQLDKQLDNDDNGVGLEISRFHDKNSVVTSAQGPDCGGRKSRSETTCDVSTMTEDWGVTSSASNQLCSDMRCFVETKAEPQSLESTAVQTEEFCDEGDAEVNYLQINDEGTVCRSRVLGTRSAETQANIDAQKINEHAQRLQEKHQRNMRRLERKFLAIRRRMRRDAHELKTCDQRRGDFLSKLQLTLPALQMEKNRLTAERFMFEKQYMYQRKKNQDLVGRITKLNQQFQVLGQTHQPSVSTPCQWRPPHLNRNLTPGLNNMFGVPVPHGDMQQQQQQHPQQQQHLQRQQEQTKQPQPAPNIKSTTQITLTQPQTPPSVPNKWLNNMQQQQQLQEIIPPSTPPPQNIQHIKHQQQQQQQQQQQVQQARLSIFQLLRNSASLANHPDEPGQHSSAIEEGGK